MGSRRSRILRTGRRRTMEWCDRYTVEYSRPNRSGGGESHLPDCALSGGVGLQFSSASTQRSLKTLLDREDFLEASFLLSVLGEGTFLDLLKFVEAHAQDPVTAEIARRTRIDEARHVHFALTHMKHAIESNSAVRDKLAGAARERASALAEIRSVNPLVEESLIVL